MKLSDAYEVFEEDVNLELTVIVLNINWGHNQELMSKCRKLGEYAYYINTVREYSKEMPIKEAVDKAIEHCIKNDVLAEFLRTHRGEVETVSIFEYNAEKHLAQEKEASRLEGHMEGKTLGKIEQNIYSIKKGMDILSASQLAEILGEDEEYVEYVKELLEENPSKTDAEIVAIVMEYMEKSDSQKVSS